MSKEQTWDPRVLTVRQTKEQSTEGIIAFYCAGKRGKIKSFRPPLSSPGLSATEADDP